MLAVDDNPAGRAILREQLGLIGCHATICADATEALERLCAAADRGEPFDAALIDRTMTGIDGLALAALVRSEPRLDPLALLLLSPSGMRGDTAAAEQAGCSGHLMVPAPAALLDALIATALARRAAGDRRLVTRPQLAEPQADRPPVLTATPGRRVLLAEDNPVNQTIGRAMLQRLGCVVTVAADGAQALEAWRRERPDLVLMDCQMPVMDGFEATAAIRAEEIRQGRARTAIVAMTANAMSEDRDRCRLAGMDDHIAKPARQQDLQEALLRWTG
jgi:CheY-like chemotaxis protein